MNTLYVCEKGGADSDVRFKWCAISGGTGRQPGSTRVRRKVCEPEILSAAMERLLHAIHFSGRLSIVVQNGQVLKSGYEEGYFCRRKDRPLLS